MGILLLFNNVDTLTLDQMSESTGMPADILSKHVAILVKAKVLLEAEEKVYSINKKFAKYASKCMYVPES